jgi:hypothetical protein
MYISDNRISETWINSFGKREYFVERTGLQTQQASEKFVRAVALELSQYGQTGQVDLFIGCMFLEVFGQGFDDSWQLVGGERVLGAFLKKEV